MRSISQAEGRVKALMLGAFVHSDSDRKFGSWTHRWHVSTWPIHSQLGKLSAPLYMDTPPSFSCDKANGGVVIPWSSLTAWQTSTTRFAIVFYGRPYHYSEVSSSLLLTRRPTRRPGYASPHRCQEKNEESMPPSTPRQDCVGADRPQGS